MMRKITTYLIATLFLALPALAQVESAAYMTVRLDSVPAIAQDAETGDIGGTSQLVKALLPH